VQTFLGHQWLNVEPFALLRTLRNTPYFDVGPPLKLASDELRAQLIEVLVYSAAIDTTNNETIDISPGAARFNNPLGSNDGTGHQVNPSTSQPYAPNVVKVFDYIRALAEFWADGPTSETPPGHWNLILQQVRSSPSFVAKWNGVPLAALEWDVRALFALNAALNDAAHASWSLKAFYNGGRPISYLRYLAYLGQRSNSSLARYNPNGIDLVPNLIELSDASSVLPGGRHQGLQPDRIVFRAWPGQPQFPENQTSNVTWVDGMLWMPYQRRTFVTPSFPGYTSGHSTFSRAGAELLTFVTGNKFFPGGLSNYTISSLIHEKGPTQPIQLQWATYYDAADQCGTSRIYGGIHVLVDDFIGRRTGAWVAAYALDKARKYIEVNQPFPTATPTPTPSATPVPVPTPSPIECSGCPAGARFCPCLNGACNDGLECGSVSFSCDVSHVSAASAIATMLSLMLG
jgi:hypothetical protein